MASIKILLRKKANAQGEYPIVMRIVKNRKSKTITLGLVTHLKHWDNKKSEFKRTHPNSNQRNRILLKLHQRALKVIDDFIASKTDFSLLQFEENFRGKKMTHNGRLLGFFDEIIEEMKASGRISNAHAYKSTRDSLEKFKGSKIMFQEVTPVFLEKYEVYLRNKGNQNGGIAFKMRELRSIINKAITREIIPQEWYPFRAYKISRLKSNPEKKALTLEEFKRIRDINLDKHPHLYNSYYFFLFSIYTRGMNFQDMMLLKWSNIQNGRIYYTRSKTKGKFNLEVIEKAREILDYYSAQNRPTDYIFPILLKQGLTEQQIFYRKTKVLRKYNKDLKELAQLAKIDKKLTSYVARHSFATILKMSGTSVEKISEMMGHSDVQVTMSYLRSFDNEVLDVENRKFQDL